MYTNNQYNVEVSIALKDNGIYIFDNESATGKTRLFKKLRELQTYGEPISTYTYNDSLLGHRIEGALIPNKYKVIMLDRYDMYEGIGANLINECSKDSIILVDCKGTFTVSREDKWCTIKMSANRIEVVE